MTLAHEHQHVPCLAHVLNLAVQAMLSKKGLDAVASEELEHVALDLEDDDDDSDDGKDGEDGEEYDEYCDDDDNNDNDDGGDNGDGEAAKSSSVGEDGRSDNDGDERDVSKSFTCFSIGGNDINITIKDNFEGGNNIDITGADNIEDATAKQVSTKSALEKLRKGITKIRKSNLLEKFMAHEQNSRGLTPLLDVCTCWNSTYMMLEQALVCQEAYTGVLTSTHYHLLLLTEGEWKRLTVLVQLLKGFKEYTNFAQAGISWATIGNTILIYNAIMEVLEKFMFIKTSNGKN
ncbi:hypothetical protein BGZ81_003578, partial [Podila clonocystis]